MTGNIFNIQRFSIHDGKGIRTTIFFKGCNNKCGWCHNPESIKLSPTLLFYADRCIGCGECFKVCEHNVHTLKNGHAIDLEKCVGCEKCTDNCYANALEFDAKTYTVDEVMKEVLKDKAFYEASQGGITLSGGEPVLQNDFALAILKEAKVNGIHTAIETAGNYDYFLLDRLIDYIDLIILDIKHADKQKLYEYTDIDLDVLKSNIKQMDKNADIIVRTPIVGSFNATEKEIEDIVKLAATIKSLLYYEFLPYNDMAQGKYERLHIEFDKNFYVIEDEDVLKIMDLCVKHVKCVKYKSYTRRKR